MQVVLRAWWVAPTSKSSAIRTGLQRAGLLTAGLLMAGVGLLHGSAAAYGQERAESLEYDPAGGSWVEQPAPERGTAAGDLQYARQLHADGDHRGALKQLKGWFKTYGRADRLYPDAELLSAAALIGQRDYYKANKNLTSFLAEYRGTQYEEAALEMKFVIAEVFLGGTKRKLLGMRILAADDIGIAILDDLANNYGDKEVGELATLTKADYYYRMGDFALAEQEYLHLVQTYGRSRYVRQSLLQSARSALASFPGVSFDDAGLIEAEDRFQRYLAEYPGSAEQDGIGLLLDDINETRASKEYDIGRYYERTGQTRAARFYYRSTVNNWPETVAALQAENRLVKLGMSVEPRDYESRSRERTEPSTPPPPPESSDNPENGTPAAMDESPY